MYWFCMLAAPTTGERARLHVRRQSWMPSLAGKTCVRFPRNLLTCTDEERREYVV